MMQTIINTKIAKKDKNGIYVVNLVLSEDEMRSQQVWEKIYHFDSTSMKQDRIDFFANKLQDHIEYIEQSYSFSKETTYLEIGCGPAYIGEYLMKKYGCYFIGVDFNYPMLVSLKKYLDAKGYKRYILMYADIKSMPLVSNSVDFIYGGGVIEHFKDTDQILSELYRILKKNGVAFNSVPAFNLFWLTRFYNNIPSPKFLKRPFEIFHNDMYHGALLKKYHGYELSFTLPNLRNIYRKAKFKNIHGGSFAFHPSSNKLKNAFLRNVYFQASKQIIFAPIYFITGQK